MLLTTILEDVDHALVVARDHRHMTAVRADQGEDRGQDRVKPLKDYLFKLCMILFIFSFIDYRFM